MSQEEEDKEEFDLYGDMIDNPGKYRKTKRTEKAAPRARSPHYKGNNEGGFGNPPVRHQFKRGNKGGGRVKGNVALETELRRMFGNKIALADGSKISMIKALTELVKKEILTNPKVLPWALEMAAKYGPQETSAGFKLDIEMLNPDELRIFGRLFDRVMPSTTKANDEGDSEITREYFPAIYEEYYREDGQIGIRRIEEKRKRWALPEDHVLGYPRDPNHRRCYYIATTGDGEMWRRSQNPDYPDVLIGYHGARSRLPKDHPDYLPAWEIAPDKVRFKYQDEGAFEPPAAILKDLAAEAPSVNEAGIEQENAGVDEISAAVAKEDPRDDEKGRD